MRRHRTTARATFVVALLALVTAAVATAPAGGRPGGAAVPQLVFPLVAKTNLWDNYGDPRGREFDLWAVDVDGGNLERITFQNGFEGFPMFSPDGTRLVWASNRNQARPGETNLFIADWVERLLHDHRGIEQHPYRNEEQHCERIAQR